MFEIEFISEAVDDLKSFRKFEQRSIFDAIIEQLSHEPVTDTRNRKKLRPNRVAEYELESASFVFFMMLMKKRKQLKLKPSVTKKVTVCSYGARSMFYENSKCLS
jgi:hypothetical protein